MLDINNLTKRFGSIEAVSQVNISVPDGAFLVLLGPSGCGKTTLLRMLAGLELPTSGQILFKRALVTDGDANWSVDPAKRNSGLVFQSYALWPHMTVRGNVEWPLKIAGMPAAEREIRVIETLELLEIQQLVDRYPNEMSGGQQQRAAIARTIAPRPAVLLLDEPLSNLDARLRVEMRTELMRLHRATGATTVYVTHDQIEAMTMASHVAVMREGRIEQFGPPAALINEPATAFVATFVGTPPNNMIPVSRSAEGCLVHSRHLPISPPANECKAMVRAEDIKVSAVETGMSLPLEMAEMSRIAGRTMITGLGGGLRLTAVVDEEPSASIGDQMHFVLPAEPAAWYAMNGRRLS